MRPWLLATFIALALALPLSAHAKQTRFKVTESGSTLTYDVAWTNAAGKTLEATFRLPADEVQEDLDERVRFRINEATRYSADAVNEWSKTLKGGTEIKATAAKGGGVSFSGTGKDKASVNAALEEAQKVQRKAMREYAAKYGWTIDSSGAIMPDHAVHAANYAPNLAPVVEALGGATDDKRVFARKALSFVQSIPYEKAPKQRDRFRRPLSLIGKNQGDCDSKVVLYLALMRQAYPQLPLAVVVIEGHAFAALGLDPEKGYDKIKIDGEKWTAVEPVGPALHPLGELSKYSAKAAKKGRFEASKVKKG